MSERVISPEQFNDDADNDRSLRPARLSDFIGQEGLKDHLLISMEAAKGRSEALEHCLLAGPPGLGKTTLANIIAEEMGGRLHISSGPVLDKASDLAGLLTSMQEGDVLFIDEIHRLPLVVEEYLYPAMEDFRLDIMLESGTASAKSLNLPLKKFTLVGATTRSGLLSAPLRDRFGHLFRLSPYQLDEITAIIRRSAKLLKINLEDSAAITLGSRCRGTPRIANRLLRRCRDVAQVRGDGSISIEIAERTLDMLGIDLDGLDDMDRNILNCIINKFDGGPVGLSTLGAALGEEPDTLEEVYEPYLIQCGFLKRTPRGRVATLSAFRKSGVVPPAALTQQADLFTD
jgi:Holliday junction DNA helicase RuvB